MDDKESENEESAMEGSINDTSSEIENADLSTSSASADQVHSTKRPIEGKATKLTKRQKEKKEDILLKKAIECMEKSMSEGTKLQKKDPDEVFGEYVATELKNVTDMKQKRIIKYKIQSVLFTALTPTPSFEPSNNYFNFPPQAAGWPDSRSPTPDWSSYNSQYLTSSPFLPPGTAFDNVDKNNSEQAQEQN